MTPVLAVESASAAGVTAFIVAVVGAAATFIVGVLNFRRQGQSLRQQETFQVRQLELARSAQLTDRFSRAIEQLGGSSNHVRMGGVFALERIARDSPDDRQHIVDTLAAFVRERLPGASVGAGGYVPILQLRAPDAQAALTVLCRSPLADERVANRQPGLLDLSRTDLRRANLRGHGWTRSTCGERGWKGPTCARRASSTARWRTQTSDGSIPATTPSCGARISAAPT